MKQEKKKNSKKIHSSSETKGKKKKGARTLAAPERPKYISSVNFYFGAGPEDTWIPSLLELPNFMAMLKGPGPNWTPPNKYIVPTNIKFTTYSDGRSYSVDAADITYPRVELDQITESTRINIFVYQERMGAWHENPSFGTTQNLNILVIAKSGIA